MERQLVTVSHGLALSFCQYSGNDLKHDNAKGIGVFMHGKYIMNSFDMHARDAANRTGGGEL